MKIETPLEQLRGGLPHFSIMYLGVFQGPVGEFGSMCGCLGRVGQALHKTIDNLHQNGNVFVNVSASNRSRY